MTSISAARSLLYTPGNRPDRIAKARSGAADVVLVDLEDSIPAQEKDAARAGAAAALADAATSAGAELWVRVDATTLDADLDVVLRPGLSGIVVPKSDPVLLDEVDRALASSPVGRDLAVVALIETAAGVLHAEEVAAHPRVVRLAIGEADLAGELRLDANEPALLDGVRMQIVLASAAAALVAPIGPVERQLNSPERLAASSRRLVQQGFRARTALHPRQLDTINDTFSPAAEEIALARAQIEAFENAGSAGHVNESGAFVDRAVVRAARDLLARADPR